MAARRQPLDEPELHYQHREEILMRRLFRWRAWLAVAAMLLLAAACAPHAPRPDGNEVAAAPLVWPKPPAQERIRYLRSVSGPQDWGISRSLFRRLFDALSGRGEEHFIRPSAVAERDGVLYVADSGAPALWILDAPRDRYARITQIGEQGLISPVALAPGPDGAVFVADTGLKVVFLVDRDGALIRSFATQGLERPAGVAWDETAQRLFVLDSLRHRVAVFDANATLLANLGESGDKDGQFNHPTHLALDASDAGGGLLITDALNFRVQAIDRQGGFLWKFGKVGNGAGDFAAPKGIAADRAGHVYVVDALFDAVQIFDRQGRLLLGFGERGGGRGQFVLPSGIYISPEDKVYVADVYNRRVQIFLGAIATAAKAATAANGATGEDKRE
jgi:DNA-binding beta-propeller fold protein YncE